MRETPVVSMDGISEFVSRTGAFYREYGEDAEPLIAWGKRAKQWIAKTRSEFGACLQHVAVASKYHPQQFRDPKWKVDEAHALDNLCVDDAFREVAIDEPRLVHGVIEKNENDATTSQEFMRLVDSRKQMALIGATTTSCITKTLGRLLPQMEARAVMLERIIASRDGFASRQSRAHDEQKILDELEKHPRIIMVKTLADICWVLNRGRKHAGIF